MTGLAVGLALVLAIGGLVAPSQAGTRELLVASYGCNEAGPVPCMGKPNTVLRYDPMTGGPSAYLGVHVDSAFLNGPIGLALHPTRGTLLVASRTGAFISEHDARTGDFIRTFAKRDVVSNMAGPQYMLFRQDTDNLLVGTVPTRDREEGFNGILEFDKDGNYVDVFAPRPECSNPNPGENCFHCIYPPGGNACRWDLNSPAQMAWAVNGNLLVAAQRSFPPTDFNPIMEYDTQGILVGLLGSNELVAPEGLTIRPPGSLDFQGLSNAGNVLVTTVYPDQATDPPTQQHAVLEFNFQLSGPLAPFFRSPVGLPDPQHPGQPTYYFSRGYAFPGALAWDPEGNLLLGDRFWGFLSFSGYSDKIYRIHPQFGNPVFDNPFVATAPAGTPSNNNLRVSEGMLMIAHDFADGDFNNDGTVDYQDGEQFRLCYGMTPDPSCVDGDGKLLQTVVDAFDDNLNGVVDLSDWDVFLSFCDTANCAANDDQCVGQDDDSPCDDGDACTVGDVCSGGVCTPGQTLSCDDSNFCTDDACHPLIGCQNLPNNDPCDDGDQCTVGDSCSSGMCLGGRPRFCDDEIGCTVDTCSPELGCLHAPQNIACDDLDPCTADTCNPAVGCQYESIICGGACCQDDGTCVQVLGADECGFVCDVAQYLPADFAGCFGDVDGSGIVNASDRGFISANIGENNRVLVCIFDLDGNGVINAADRGFVSANIGNCEPLPDYQDGSGINHGTPDLRFGPPAFFAGEGTECGTVVCPE